MPDLSNAERTIVIGAERASRDALIAQGSRAASALAAAGVPKRFVFHDKLPREASGKIKRKLRDAYLQAVAPR